MACTEVCGLAGVEKLGRWRSLGLRGLSVMLDSFIITPVSSDRPSSREGATYINAFIFLEGMNL